MTDVKPIEIKDVNALLDKFKEFKNKATDAGETWIFRGQKCSEDTKGIAGIQTALERAISEFQLDMREAPQIEGGLLRRFKRQCQNYLANIPAAADYMEWFALMQHYGAPTRLLDWTYSFFVAVYFAVEDEDPKHDREVWALKTDKIDDKVREIFSEDKDVLKILSEDPNTQIPGNFTKMFMREPPEAFVCPMNPYNLNERLVIQQGVFLCPGDVSKPFKDNLTAVFRSNKIEDNLLNFKIKIIDNLKLRKEIIHSLHRMNMNRYTLFPGLDGFAKSMKLLLAFPDVLKLLPPDSKYIQENLWD